jgi:hypothetical protein
MESVTRTPPSAATLIESRKRNNVPAGWDWDWCEAPGCDQFVWYSPAQKSDTLAGGLRWFLTCSASCTLTLLSELPPRTITKP